MKKLIIYLCLFNSVVFYAQSNILNASNPSEIGIKNYDQKQSDSESSFLEHEYIDDRDILWSKIVYEKIDLNEKLNFPLLFPIDDKTFRARKSLWRILNENIKSRKITELYRANNDQFLPEKKLNEASIDSIVSSSINIGGEITINEIKSVDIKSYFIKGIWYFDKRQSEMKYRLLGIMPSGDIRNNEGEIQETDLFWIWYPSIRKILHKEMVFNDKSNANRISFDQLLVSRRFSSFIYKEDNVYGGRAIKDYKKPGLESILESERIKKEILDFEQDMWNR
jgi:gliding motility associated protien GldN